MDTSVFPKFSMSAFVRRDTQKQHFNWTPSPIIDTFQMMLLLLVEWPLHPLTLGQTFLLTHPQRREVEALKELGQLRQAALNLHCHLLTSEHSLASAFQPPVTRYRRRNVCG